MKKQMKSPEDKKNIKSDAVEPTMENSKPVCACGRVDLYAESLKLKENENDESVNPTNSTHDE